jgi:LPXTG-motif cell wall-anchored protein
MTAPEPARRLYWSLQILTLVVGAVVMIAAGVAGDGDPIGFVIAGLCLVTAVGLTVLWRRRRL